MSTMKLTSPIPALLGALGQFISSAEKQRDDRAFLRRVGRGRSLAEIDDWILNDIGLVREDRMSPEARRTMARLTSGSFW